MYPPVIDRTRINGSMRITKLKSGANTSKETNKEKNIMSKNGLVAKKVTD